MGSVGGVYIVVPAFNEAGAVYDVVCSIRARFPDVVVVDDGSRDATSSEARRAGAVVLRHVINRGQGAAIQTGIDYALMRGAEVIVTFDADGQHRVADVERLVHALDEDEAEIAIGSRFLGSHSNVPAFRRLILRVATVFMRLTSGVKLTDAHNGLRALRRSAAERIHLSIDGMAHASEIVDQIRENRIRVTEVPVIIEYSEYSMSKGQSSTAAFRIAFDYLMKRLFR
jgi:polyprenyl-phospho-N-acetylgalactosaminyl synthase